MPTDPEQLARELGLDNVVMEDGEYERRVDRIREALTAAHRAGRVEGLREAEEVCRDAARDRGITLRSDPFVAAEQLGDAIRRRRVRTLAEEAEPPEAGIEPTCPPDQAAGGSGT